MTAIIVFDIYIKHSILVTITACTFKIVYPSKVGIPFGIKDDGFYFCSDESCELFCYQSLEAMLQGDFSIKPINDDFLFGGDNHKNEITIVLVNFCFRFIDIESPLNWY